MKQDITPELIKEATTVFTEKFNFEKSIEEMGELLQAIQKYKDHDSIANYFKVYEEVIDLAICVLMAKEYMEQNDERKIFVDPIMKEKLDRFRSRIDKRKKDNEEK